MKTALSLIALAALGVNNNISQAALIASYTGGPVLAAPGVNNPAGLLPTTTDPLLSAATPLFFSTSTSATIGGGSSTPLQTGDGAVTRSDTITNNSGASATYNIFQISPTGSTDYIEFTLTPTAGVDLGTIAFDVARLGSAQVRSFGVQYSFGSTFNAATAISTATAVILSSGPHTYDHYSYALLDQNNAAQLTTSAITFRLLATVDATTRSIGFDNISVTGSAVPEPTGLAMGAVFACAAGMKRRRQSV